MKDEPIGSKALVKIIAKLEAGAGAKHLDSDDYHPAPYTAGYVQALDDVLKEVAKHCAKAVRK